MASHRQKESQKAGVRERSAARKPAGTTAPATPAVAPAQSPPLPVSAADNLRALHRAHGNRAVGRLPQRAEDGAPPAPDPRESFARATRGATNELPFRREMEQAFNEDLSGVRTYLGRGENLKELGALGATDGEAMAFA